MFTSFRFEINVYGIRLILRFITVVEGSVTTNNMPSLSLSFGAGVLLLSLKFTSNCAANLGANFLI